VSEFELWFSVANRRRRAATRHLSEVSI